ncbi:MAG: PEGA domain-containing protein [Sandaracinaceae bacterium]|jgi:hypothetical protein|nr:PEGA domain-containing protein [Sandaracinaceae bacterium]
MYRLALVCCFALLASLGVTSAAEAQRPIPVNIQSTPPGAQVFLDVTTGPSIGMTPMANVRVPSGSHVLIFRLDGYEEGRLPVSIARRRETFRVTLAALGAISITAGNDAAGGAAIRIDGQPAGNVPFRTNVQPGRHMVQVGREGYVTFNQWMEVAGGQIATLPVMLEREAPQTGSLLVAGDVSGAPIYVDGDPRGVTPQVIEGLTAGSHTIEVRAPGMPPFSQAVTITAGARATLNPVIRPAAPTGGTVRIITNVAGARISIDGEVAGPAPVSRDNLSPGEHILEAQADGYAPLQQVITIEPGAQRAISLTLQPQAAAPGRIVVNASVEGAVVTIDGADRGAPPIVQENATAGTHAIVVTAQGYDTLRTTCEVRPGHDCEINARMQPIGTPVRVTANARAAELFVDGESRGPVPFEGNLPVGHHQIEVRAEGYNPHIEQIELVAQNGARVIQAVMESNREGPTPEEAAADEAERIIAERIGAMTHAAGPLPADLFVVDLSIGIPYLAEVRLGVGVNNFLELGFATRTFGRMTEFEGRVELSYRPIPQIGVGGVAHFGGGIGAASTWFANFEGMFSLYFANRGAFTLWFGLDNYTDKWPYAETDSSTEMPLLGRDNGTRARLGGSLEFVLTNRWNVFGVLEGIVAGNNRRAFGDFIWTRDPMLYFRLGLTYKF